jgi:hypothetical protein
MEHATPEALKKYLRDHPNADKSKHKVEKKEDEEKPKEDKPKAAPKGKGLDFGDTSKLGKDVQQAEKDPDKLFKQAEKAHEEQLDWLNRGKGLDKAIGGTVVRADKKEEIDFDKPGPIIVIGPMKKQERSKEKVEADFGGDWSRLGDIVRSSVAVDSFDQVEDVLAKLKKSGLKLARQPKDRFEKPTDAGYRDVMINVEYPNGHVGELQIHLKGVLKAKDAGHKFYDEVRTIEGKAKKEGRETLTDEEAKVVKEANDKMKALYDEAWGKATGGGGKTKNAFVTFVKKALAKSEPDTKQDSKTKTYYNFNGLPAYWDPKKFPKVLKPGGGEKAVYDFEKFFREADKITEAEFKELKKDTGKHNKDKSANTLREFQDALIVRNVVARFVEEE